MESKRLSKNAEWSKKNAINVLQESISSIAEREI
jgi:hypothetical protein